jgi:hypothetical protein
VWSWYVQSDIMTSVYGVEPDGRIKGSIQNYRHISLVSKLFRHLIFGMSSLMPVGLCLSIFPIFFSLFLTGGTQSKQSKKIKIEKKFR